MADEQTATQDATTEAPIIIYSTSWCAFCKTEAQYLASKNIPYVMKDVEEDEAAYNELMGKIGGNFQGVPVTDIKGEIILGFDRPKIDAAIEKNGITAEA